MRFSGIRLCLLVALSIFFACLASRSTSALMLEQADGIESPVSLSGHLAIFHDSSGALTIDDVVSVRDQVPFRPVPSMLTEGYSRGAIWVRFSLSAATISKQWMLQVERPLIEQVTLYVPDGKGHYAVSPPGRISSRKGNSADAYPTIFPMPISSIPSEYYLRLQSSTSITSALNIWQSQAYDRYRRLDDWIMAMVVGAIFVMILTNLLYAVWLREQLYIIYTWLLVQSGLISLFHMGYASEVLQFLDPASIHRSWGIIVCLYSIAMMLFLDRLFEFRHHWLWAAAISQGVILLNGVALVFATMGRYGDVGFFVSRLQQLSLIFVAAFVLYLLIVRRQYQYVLSAIAFLSVIGVLLVMQMMYTGANPFLLDNSLSRLLAGGTVIHLILLSAAVAQRARLAEHGLRAAKDRVIAISQAAERDLTIKVRERTVELAESNASLKAEVDRRRQLETMLRQSLDSVNNALAQQQDFVAMVSHEFRGPLAVIASTADNLRFSVAEDPGNVDLRIDRIGRTVKRMSMLIENILAGDRLNAGPGSFAKVEVFDLNEILHTAKAGLDDDAGRRVNFVHCGAAMVKGDRILLEVVVQNLIQNALKYSAATDFVRVQLSTDQGVAFVNVVDQGNGIAHSDRELIFMKYYRAAGQSASGSGLGLYISREIAQQSGGDLILAASDATGSTFCLSLPIEQTTLHLTGLNRDAVQAQS
ncbi:7TM-DISM domain-containing protein [Devosia sp. ZW T5_3]|uniref:sensor histidine kinase n=1 Tax=Devosia sp. ZW T5_3 TaxID=3378085 RepID=UPI00385344DF